MFVDNNSTSDPLRRRLRRLTSGEKFEEAMAFVDLFHRETGAPDAQRKVRRREVASALNRSGWYDHTADELAFGSRVAWRNSSRCVGRLFWKSLEVIDCRHVTDPDEIAARLFAHLRMCSEGDRVPSMISVFAPVRGENMPAYVENPQLVQYAGYLPAVGPPIGDPQNVELTVTARTLGWIAPTTPGHFDVLPLIIRNSDGGRLVYPLPPEICREVAITHPDCPAVAKLGLRWYAVPVVSDMILSIGGIDYPCAPFNGYYVATEIASRNLVDEIRYNRLQDVADALGLDRSNPLWKDTALTELNRAVLHSFRIADVTICDHHAASEWHLSFEQNERASARVPSSDWSWIVPPQAAAACPTFHLPMVDTKDVPNFYRSRASDGAGLGVSRAAERESKAESRFRRIKKRFRDWIRRRAA